MLVDEEAQVGRERDPAPAQREQEGQRVVFALAQPVPRDVVQRLRAGGQVRVRVEEPLLRLGPGKICITLSRIGKRGNTDNVRF